MNRMLARALITATIVSTACSTADVPPDSSAEVVQGFQTSLTRYDARRVPGGFEIDIPYVYRNVTGDSVYFVNCNEIIVPSLEKKSGETWSSVWTGATDACLSPPMVVPPRREYRDSVRVRTDPNTYPLLSPADIDGTYRLVWHGVVHSYRDEGPHFGNPLSQDERTSNEFTIVAPAGD
jgi:hypothetical protein